MNRAAGHVLGAAVAVPSLAGYAGVQAIRAVPAAVAVVSLAGIATAVASVQIGMNLAHLLDAR